MNEINSSQDKCIKCGDSEGTYPSGMCKSPRCHCYCEFPVDSSQGGGEQELLPGGLLGGIHALFHGSDLGCAYGGISCPQRIRAERLLSSAEADIRSQPNQPAQSSHEALVDFMKEARDTHLHWAEHFEAHPELEMEYVASGEWDSAETHRKWEAIYNDVITLLSAPGTASVHQ